MFISTIIPVYNGEKYLAEAIQSILDQNHHPMEVIVVDDGSTDNSAQIAKDFGPPVHYYYQEQSGAGAARNYGVSFAKGDFLAFLDADDLWSTDKLATQIEAFVVDPQLDMVFGHVKQFYSLDIADERREQLTIPTENVPGYSTGAMLIKRAAFDKIGPFSTQWELVEMVDWYARAQDSGLTDLMLPQVVMERRVHKTNQGIYKREHRIEYVRLMKTILDRRRKEQIGILAE